MKIELDVINTEITNLNKDYADSPYSRALYLKRHKALVRKYNKIAKGETASERMKRVIGAKVTRSKTHMSTYTYHGKNFTVELTEEACETTWWEVSIWVDGVDERLHEHFDGYNQFDTKKEVVWSLYCYDCELSNLDPYEG